MATQTANGKYKYSDEYHGKKLDEWVQETNRRNCIANNWKVNPLRPGGFGYDNLAVSIGTVFDTTDVSEIRDMSKLDTIADKIHRGWTINYLFWRDNTPWIHDKRYTKPSALLGDERRNMCANTEYINLPEEEKNKDRDIACFLRDILNEI